MIVRKLYKLISMLSTGDSIRFDRRLLWNLKFGQRSTRHWRSLSAENRPLSCVPQSDSFLPFRFSFIFRISSKVIVIGGYFRVYTLIRLVCLYLSSLMVFSPNSLCHCLTWNEQQTRLTHFFVCHFFPCKLNFPLKRLLLHFGVAIKARPLVHMPVDFRATQILTINGHFGTTT